MIDFVLIITPIVIISIGIVILINYLNEKTEKRIVLQSNKSSKKEGGDYDMNELSLYVPSFEELKYRQLILSQEDTMSYNKGYNLEIENYNNETGCIDFSRKYWNEWYSKWVSERVDRYYAYIVNSKTGEFVGDVCFYYDAQNDLHRIGIVIENKHRSNGYCSKGLLKLAGTAFNNFNVKVLRNVIPLDRKSAINGHKSAGFKEISIDDNLITLDLVKSEHLSK